MIKLFPIFLVTTGIDRQTTSSFDTLLGDRNLTTPKIARSPTTLTKLCLSKTPPRQGVIPSFISTREIFTDSPIYSDNPQYRPQNSCLSPFFRRRQIARLRQYFNKKAISGRSHRGQKPQFAKKNFHDIVLVISDFTPKKHQNPNDFPRTRIEITGSAASDDRVARPTGEAPLGCTWFAVG